MNYYQVKNESMNNHLRTGENSVITTFYFPNMTFVTIRENYYWNKLIVLLSDKGDFHKNT